MSECCTYQTDREASRPPLAGLLPEKSHRTWSMACIAGMLGCLCLTAGCKKTEEAQMPEWQPPVSAAAAIAQDVPVYLDEIGKCVARELVTVQPQVSGQITKIHFADGADLKAGDPLFTIDPRPYQAQLDAAEASLAEEKAILDLAQTAYARAARLLPHNAIARAEYDQAENLVEVAKAKILSCEAAVKTAKLNLDYCSIRSPIDGRAGQRLIDLGNVVTANTGASCSLLVIQRLDPIYADFTVTENDLSSVQQHVKIGEVRAEVRLPDQSDDVRSGELTFVDNAVQDATGTIKLRATLPNADDHFWPGRFVKVRLVLSTLKNAVLIPACAPQVSAKGSYVYVVDANSAAELRPVVLGQRHGDLVVVTQGVNAGEQVITAGQMAVMPGGKVAVEKPAAAETPPPTEPAGDKS